MSERAQKSTLGRLRALFPFLVSGALLAFIAYRFEGYDLLASARLDVLLIAVVAAVALVSTAGAAKWWAVARLSDIDISFKAIWRIWTAMLTVTFFAPFQSGQVVYVVALKRATGISLVRSVECVVYDKYLSIVGTGMLVVIGQLLLPADHVLSRWWIMAAGLTMVLIFLVDTQLLALLGRWSWLRERSSLVHARPPRSGKLGLLSIAVLYQASDTLSMALACWALGIDLDLLLVFGAFPVVVFVAYMPVTFAGFGLRENMTELVYRGTLTADQSYSAGLLVSFLEYVAPALFGLVAMRYLIGVLGGSIKAAAREVAEEEPEGQGHGQGRPTSV